MKKTFTFLSALALILLFSAGSMQGQSPVPKVESPVYFDVSPPLKDMVPTTTPDRIKSLNKDAEKREYPFYKYEGPDPAWQKQMGTKDGSKGLVLNFEGTPLLSNAAPSDDNGDIGPDHYVQTVNCKLEIYDRAGTTLYGPVNINTLFSGVTGGEYNDGDPIVLYDQAANRWLISEFSISGATKYMLIAVSTSGNPLGTYYRWSYSWGTSVPDYPKFGVWRDSYLMALNCGTDDVVAFDRDEMIAGNSSPSVVKFDNPWRPNSGLHCIQPCDNDGAFAASGTPGLFITINDNAWNGGFDQLWVYELDVNWTFPFLSTFTRINTLGVNSFDSNFGGTWDNIPQPGTAQKLEVLPQVLMYRAQYRNFGTYQSIVCCHDVDVNGSDHAGIRWYEVRNSGGGWYVRQQSTYAPDAHHRWMGSISQNGSGDIALGFTIASTSVYPSIRYTGRTASDPLNTMTYAENIIFTGTASQTSGNRWGDYSSMSVDPSDDMTFWYTSQYTTGGYNWHTRIAAFNFDSYCEASGGCVEYISRVQIGSINNFSACDGYRDYGYISTDLAVNTANTVTVTNGNPYSPDQCGIWVDWNRDNDFTDAGEAMSVSGNPGLGPYTASIYPPIGTATGAVKMRVRITWSTAPTPCGTSSYGEVEDYTLNLTAPVANVWDGSASHYWHNANNWSLNHIPHAGEPVQVPNVGYQPVYVDNYVGFTKEECASLLIGAGARLDVQTMELVIHDNLTINGRLGMTDDDGVIRCYGDVAWNSGSTANFTADGGVFWAYQDWNFNSGANANMANGWVDFTGTTNSYIRSYSSTCALPDLANYKNAGTDWIYISNLSTQPLTINGNLYNQSNCNLGISSSADVILKGNFSSNGNYNFTLGSNTGTFVFDGTTQSISHGASTTGVFNNVRFSSSTMTFTSNDITVAKNLTIDQGTFSPGSTTVTVGRDWTNTVGTAGFSEGASRVIFNGGNYHQLCSNETFNILEVNKASGGAFRMDGTHVVCAAYDWTAGAVDVLTGSFTANDLLDGLVKGAFYANTGGTINLNSAYVDLGGELHNYGGTINLSGGASWWPFGGNATVEMTGGVIDLTGCGLYIYNTGTWALNDNITGGTIRTPYGFSGNRADFTPVAGTFEFYGSGDAYLSQSNGCTLPNVKINKSAKGTDDLTSGAPVVDARSGEVVAPGSKSNSILLNSDFKITNNLMISAGSFILNGHKADVDNYCHVYGSLVMTNAADELYVGTSSYDNLEFHGGSNSTLTAGEIYPASWVYSSGAATVNGGTGNTIYFTGGYGGIEVDGPGSIFGNVDVNKTGNLLLYSVSGNTIELAGNFNLHAGNVLEMYHTSMTVHGTATDNATSSIYLSYSPYKGLNHELNGAKGIINPSDAPTTVGLLTIDTDLTLNGLLDIADGNVLVHGIFSTASTGSVLISSGSFIADAPVHGKGWEYLNGNLTMSDGLFEISHNSIQFSSSATTSITGGTLRSGEAFAALYAGTFQPSGGTVEIVGVGSNTIYCQNGNYFHNLLINRDPAASSWLLTDIVVNNNLTVNAGSLHMNSYDASIMGGVTINGGILNVNSNANLLLASGTAMNVNSGGTLNVLGLTGIPATVSRMPAGGNYAFNVNSGGTIAAQDGIFEYMNANGVNLLSGSLVDPDFSFRRCTFRNGPAGGTLLRAHNSQSIIIREAVFPTNAGGGAYNVTKTVRTGHVYFLDYSGIFSGESYDNDAYNLIDWVAPLTATATATPGTICGGTSTQLDITQAGGVAPFTYNWSPTAGLSDPAIRNPVATPLATTTYNVTVTDFIGTAVTGSILVTVIPATPVSVSIVASANPSPPDHFVTFTATPVGGGTIPSYQWQLNGSNVGAGLPAYSYVPSYGHQVKCYLTSNAICPTPNPAESNTITMAVVVTNQTVTGIIPSPESICFDASNTVTVAGGGSTFTVSAGASATIVAGVRIIYLPTTTVEPGAYMHGYITATNEYCGSLPLSKVSLVDSGEEEFFKDPLEASRIFSIFPNPTSGICTLMNKGENITGKVQVEIFNMHGELLLSTSFSGERAHQFTLTGVPPGLYFVKVTNADLVESFKLIVNR